MPTLSNSWLPTTPAVSAAAFEDVIALHPAVVFHVWAIWDGHDRTMDTRLQELRPHFEGRIAFFSLNYDDEALWGILRCYDVVSPPVLLCFTQGQWRENIVGVYPAAQLQAKLDALLTL
ncbi:MAG: thioredoxin family protein [Armatimonadota bacterium]